MSQNEPQNFSNHVRMDWTMTAAFVLAALAFLLSLVTFLRQPSLAAATPVLLSAAAFIIAWRARVYGVTVQDRVIRLEMQLRLARLLKCEMEGREHEFTPKQLVGLRFASDAELPDLARRVLAEKITKARDIKALVKDWQADHLRV